MKFRQRLLLLLLILSAVLPARADNVSREKAAEAARAFFGPEARRASGTSQGQKGDASLTEAAYSSPAMAVFNRDGGGFVVISLNDAVPPVLAWSPDGRFPSKEEMPEPMAWWFSGIESQIEAVGPDAQATEAVRKMWEEASLSGGFRSGEKLYQTASWKQSAPFNGKCPVDAGGVRCITGCVATAGAIIARYFEWPSAGEGTVPAKDNNTGGPYYPENVLGHAYDWSNMPLDYSGGYTPEQADQVATLMYDMGTIARMAYGPGASSANDGVLLSGLKQYMKYNKGAYMVNRSDYSDEDWTAMMRNNLDACGPTIYSGRDPSRGGHSFVLDGYDTQGRFHFNWGWGFANCYCEINNLAPATPSGYVFSANHEMILELVPDRDGTSTGRDWLTFAASGNYSGLRADTDSFETGKWFTCYAGWISPKVSDFDGSVYFALYDKNGNHKEDISSSYELDIVMGVRKAFGISCCIRGTIAPGDRIKLRYVGQYNAGIIDFGEGCVTEIIVMPDSGGPDPDPTAGYTAAQTAASTSLSYAKASATLTLTFTNPANWTVKNSGGTIVATGTAAAGGPVAIDLSGYAAGTYTVLVGSTEDPYTFTITK